MSRWRQWLRRRVSNKAGHSRPDWPIQWRDSTDAQRSIAARSGPEFRRHHRADRDLEPGPLAPILADAAAAIHNARLYRDAVLGLAEARSARPLADAPAPARDFANLLAVVLGRLTALRDRLKDADAVRDLDVAEEAAWRAAEGIRGLLGFAPGQRAAPLAPPADSQTHGLF